MEIIYWEIKSEVSPVLEFMKIQPVKARAKIQWVIDFFEAKGLGLLGTSDYLVKLKGYDLFELRIRASKIFYRIFIVIKESVAWLVHAFKKKGDRTPMNEIRVGLNRLALINASLAY